MKTVFHWNPFVIFNHRITLEEVWLMQFKFSPDKLNYSSWRRLWQKTKQSSQSVSHQLQELLQNIPKKQKPHFAAPWGEVLLLVGTAARRAQDLILVPTATSYLLFSKAAEDPGHAHWWEMPQSARKVTETKLRALSAPGKSCVFSTCGSDRED